MESIGSSRVPIGPVERVGGCVALGAKPDSREVDVVSKRLAVGFIGDQHSLGVVLDSGQDSSVGGALGDGTVVVHLSDSDLERSE